MSLTIALGSQSQVKQTAISNAIAQFELDAELVAVKARSGIAEQPFNEETLRGAKNRAVHAAQLVRHADLAIAIESGIFVRKPHLFARKRYLDIAIVLARLQDGTFVSVESDSVEFPEEAVLETKRRGVQDWTTGRVLQEWGLVAQHDDPHFSLTGKSRAEYINEAALRLFEQLRFRGVL